MHIVSHRRCLGIVSFLWAASGLMAAELRLGMVGLDTGHVVAFTKVLHDKTDKDHIPGVRMVGAVKTWSEDIESSRTRVEEYTKKLQTDYGVKLYPSIEALAKDVDGILVESVDGRPHLAQASAAIKAGKPIYIEKPIAASLKEAIEIFTLAKKHRIPVFSSSGLRFARDTLSVRAGKIGRVKQAVTHSPAPLEPHHIDLFWYGVHGVESLFTVMGTGIERVERRPTTNGLIESVGFWKGGRIGTFQEVGRGPGTKPGTKPYSGHAIGEKGEADIGSFDGYAPLVAAIVKFFQTGIAPVSPRETLEIIAFMEADALSKARGGQAVAISEVFQKAGWQGSWPGDL